LIITIRLNFLGGDRAMGGKTVKKMQGESVAQQMVNNAIMKGPTAA
jgi:hypothetical protein